jgi:hypothetical protein
MTQEPCPRCTNGTRRDATLADKVCAGGTTVTKCNNCRGTGIVLKLTREEMLAEMQGYLSQEKDGS